MSNLKFAETHNLVAFIEKPEESDGFEGIIDFLNASSIRYVLTMNPIIYTSCIKKFWATAKEKTVNGEVQIQALVDGKKVIVTEMSVRRALQLKDTEGTECYHFRRTGKNRKKQPRRKQRKDTEVPQPSGSIEPITDEAANEEHVHIYSNGPLLSEIAKLKERVKKLERMNKSRTPRLKRLRKVGRTARIESSEDEGLGAQEDASKQGRKIADLDADTEVTLVDETRGMNDDDLMFDTRVFYEQEVKVEKVVSTAEVTTASATTTTVDELTLAQTLIEIKAAKPKAVTTAATTTTTAVTRPKARGVVVQEPSEFRTTTSSSQTSQLPQAKDKGKAKMIEPEKPLKKKDQILIDEEIAQKLQAQLNVELEEEEKLAKQREEDANIAEWDNVQAMIDADYELAARLQAQEQEELTVEEKSKLFVELMDKRKKHFARLRAEEQRRKPPTKAQKINQMFSVSSETRTEGSSKRAREELESDNSKKKKLDENVKAEVDDEAEMKKHMEMVSDNKVEIDAIPLATKPPIISIDREDLETLWKLVKAKEHGESKYGGILPRAQSDTFGKLFSSVDQNLGKGVGVFECILLVKIKLLIKKVKDLENEHQVYGKIVGIKRLFEDVWKLLLLRLELLLLRITSYC
ncbi:hypothetical protein Tco_0800558 [Tanacetum coccineum]|uniref:Xylulose kinase-1 n=1 Tax=Tanacetum coccineum TaxID=301880 RepID=A0ABQ4ZUF2_9ASTR